MSLEEDVVIQRMSQGSDAKDMNSFIEALESTGLKIDRVKVNTALRRYELIQKYNSQDNNKRAVKKRKEYLFRKVNNQVIENFRDNNPSVVETSLVWTHSGFDQCDICGEGIAEYVIKYIKMVKKDDIIIKIQSKTKVALKYCDNCGNFSINDLILK